MGAMVSKVLSKVLERVYDWPAERQEAAAEVLLAIEEQERTNYRLSDEQVAEVERRRAKLNRKFVSLKEVRAYFARRKA